MAGFATHLVSQVIPRTPFASAATPVAMRLAITPGLPPIDRPRTTTEAVAPQDVAAPRKSLQDNADRQPNIPRIVALPPASSTAVSRANGGEQLVAIAAPAPPTAPAIRVGYGSPSGPPRVIKSAAQRRPADSATRFVPAHASPAMPPRRADAPLRPAATPAVVNAIGRPPAHQRRTVTVRIGRIEIVAPAPRTPAPVIAPPVSAPLPATRDPLESLWPARAGYSR
jgi:hypothetical protein